MYVDCAQLSAPLQRPVHRRWSVCFAKEPPLVGAFGLKRAQSAVGRRYPLADLSFAARGGTAFKVEIFYLKQGSHNIFSALLLHFIMLHPLSPLVLLPAVFSPVLGSELVF